MSDLAPLVRRASALAATVAVAGGHRALLGITGAPGAGKSTLAARLASELGPQCRLVGMDGFHIADAALRSLGLRDRKGAPETFDRDGYAAALARLRSGSTDVWVPVFHRALEDSLAAALLVPAEVTLVITEGNYLLVWPEVGALLEEIWFLDPDPGLRVQALVQRHIDFGKTAAEAAAWAHGPDERNAELIQSHRDAADLVLGWIGD